MKNYHNKDKHANKQIKTETEKKSVEINEWIEVTWRSQSENTNLRIVRIDNYDINQNTKVYSKSCLKHKAIITLMLKQ